MKAIEKRLQADEQPAILFRLEKWVQIHAGKWPAIFFCLYRLARQGRTNAVTPETQLVIEGFPRSANTFAVTAFRQAQDEEVRIAHHLHVPAQVIRAARWQIPTLVLIRKPKDAILSLAIRDPISVDQALRYYISFYETVAALRDAYVLALFEEVISDYGMVIERVNAKFGTTFSPFRHNKRNVRRVLARMDKIHDRRHSEASRETKVSRPSAVREQIKREVEYETEAQKRRRLITEAEAVYDYLTASTRE